MTRNAEQEEKRKEKNRKNYLILLLNSAHYIARIQTNISNISCKIVSHCSPCIQKEEEKKHTLGVSLYQQAVQHT